MSTTLLTLISWVGLSLGANHRLLHQALPAQPSIPVLPEVPAAPVGPQLEKNCVLEYTNAASCAGKAEVITNPGNYFQMDCAALGACAQSTTTFQFTPATTALYIDTVIFSEQYAGYGATIVVEDIRVGSQAVLNKLECKALGACQGLTIILKNADLNELNCGDVSYCPDCWIRENLIDPPKPCFGW
eukprot:CAMPEP_0197043648 /NCGR_PEP_ID=MMETSP1384-20130603/19866_1 /TAXON_ID=29189 /ORGANISM="Ammonia sp." /LENGTH=186 /DNA_ID=CAMNT_0042474979 /DNA_START=102 /DNA_END=662 /DNA_ORIENTATION=+